MTVSESAKAMLENKYGIPWHRTPENRAFLGARQKCEQRGVQFLYNTLDDFLLNVGFRPGENFALEQIDATKDFGPGNVRWSLMIVINRKHRPDMQAERTLDTMMLRIIQTLKRQPNMEMARSVLQHSSGSAKWGAPVFHDAVQQLIKLGFVDYSIEERTQIEPDGHHPGLTRCVTRKIPIVRLKQQVEQVVENG
jgi:hypothetical protein